MSQEAAGSSVGKPLENGMVRRVFYPDDPNQYYEMYHEDRMWFSIPEAEYNAVRADAKSDGESLTTAEHTQAHGDKITGYKKLSPAQLEAVNKCKQLEVEIAALFVGFADNVDQDPRWVAKARTAYEEAGMFLIRSIAQPESPFDP